MKQSIFPSSWWAIGGSVALGLLLAVAIRLGILENEVQARLCDSAPGGWCVVRAAVGWSIYMQLFGLAALGLATAAWIPALRRLTLPALLLAGCGLFVYNATFAAVAAVLALLAALQPAPIPADLARRDLTARKETAGHEGHREKQ